MARVSELVDHSWNWAFKVGAVAFVIIGAWYVFGIFWPLLVGVPAPGFATPPVLTNQQYFNTLASHPTAATVFYAMYSLVDFLVIPAVIALYLALKGIHKNAMLVAMALAGVWAIIDVSVTQFNSLALISLTQSYNATTDVVQKAAYMAAANYALAAIPIATFYSYIVGSVAFFIAAAVMLRGVFRRAVAYLGIVANGLGFISAFVLFGPGLAVILVPALVLFGLWNILVGARLYTLASQPA
jgi:hypothetical protein